VTAVVVNVAAEWRAYNRERSEGDAPSAADG
jgi:hypothetical protein